VSHFYQTAHSIIDKREQENKDKEVSAYATAEQSAQQKKRQFTMLLRRYIKQQQ